MWGELAISSQPIGSKDSWEILLGALVEALKGKETINVTDPHFQPE